MRRAPVTISAAMLATMLATMLAAVLAACSGSERPQPERPRPERADAGAPLPDVVVDPGLVVPEDDRAPQGPACMRTDECESGQQCRGARGCGSEWACGEARACLDEVVAYCDCDGSTFYARGGCPGRPYASVGPCAPMGELVAAGTELGIPDWDEQPTTQDRTCESSRECGRGLTCFGIAGCATEWHCVRARGCTRDRVPFCGCDGETFVASSTCPGRPFVHRGECRGEAIASADAPDAGTGTTERDAGTRVARAEPDAGARVARAEPDAGPRIARAEPDAGARVAAGPRDAGALAMSVAEEPAPRRGERVCSTSRDCPGGQVCQGPPGCGMEWTCGRPERPCVRDTQVFCDCQGRDFRASMFCPGRPYAHRGSCEIDRLLDLSGAATR